MDYGVTVNIIARFVSKIENLDPPYAPVEVGSG